MKTFLAACALCLAYAAVQGLRQVDWAVVLNDDVKPLLFWDWKPSSPPVGDDLRVEYNAAGDQRAAQ